MYQALAIAATGMEANETNLDVTANNMANISTTGFKRAQGEFADLMYQTHRAQGVPPEQGAGSVIPEGVRVGLGTQLVAVRKLHIQGSLITTGNQLDLAINGRGWFQITGPGGEITYTRAGALNTDGTGQIVTVDGYALEPAMVVPQNTTAISVSKQGQVYATVSGQAAPQLLGQITLATFANDAGLDDLGGNLSQETEASGPPVVGVPGDPGFGTLHQGYLEASNVDPIKEITNLITTQRAYEMNSKVLQAADQMLGVVSQGIR